MYGLTFRAAWDARQADHAAALGEPGGVPVPYERLRELWQECGRWSRWREAPFWAALLTFGASILAFLIRPGTLPAASCVFCGLMAMVAYEASCFYY
jgi:hypothetical protein